LGFVEAPDQKAAELVAAKALHAQRLAAQTAIGASAFNCLPQGMCRMIA
jgi:hypothetical protein